MTELTAIFQTPAAVAQVEDQNSNRRAENNENGQNSALGAVADPISISTEGLQLSQAAQPAGQVAEQNDTQQQTADQSSAGAERNPPVFLDIRV